MLCGSVSVVSDMPWNRIVGVWTLAMCVNALRSRHASGFSQGVPPMYQRRTSWLKPGPYSEVQSLTIAPSEAPLKRWVCVMVQPPRMPP